MGKKKQQERAEREAQRRQDFLGLAKKAMEEIEASSSYVKQYLLIKNLREGIDAEKKIVKAHDISELRGRSGRIANGMAATGAGSVMLGSVGALAIVATAPATVPIAVAVSVVGGMSAGLGLMSAGSRWSDAISKRANKKLDTEAPSQDWVRMLDDYDAALEVQEEDLLKNHMADMALDQRSGDVLAQNPSLKDEFLKALVDKCSHADEPKIVHLPKPFGKAPGADGAK
ncbi:MAG: hypothetical protein OXT65_11660 [Alphaproteobacteria bacterium]|nr:hypothetical protein [Alphaproteobacteria bacterium]